MQNQDNAGPDLLTLVIRTDSGYAVLTLDRVSITTSTPLSRYFDAPPSSTVRRQLFRGVDERAANQAMTARAAARFATLAEIADALDMTDHEVAVARRAAKSRGWS